MAVMIEMRKAMMEINTKSIRHIATETAPFHMGGSEVEMSAKRASVAPWN